METPQPLHPTDPDSWVWKALKGKHLDYRIAELYLPTALWGQWRRCNHVTVVGVTGLELLPTGFGKVRCCCVAV